MNELRLIFLALEVLIVGNTLILKFDFYLVTQSRGWLLGQLSCTNEDIELSYHI